MLVCGVTAAVVLYTPRKSALLPDEHLFDDNRPRITEPEDGGAILVDSVTVTDNHYTAVLRLKPERGETYDDRDSLSTQWFNFEAQGLPVGSGAKASFVIKDCGSSKFNDWRGYQVCYSRDRVHWHRAASTTFNPADGSLRWTLNDNSSPIVYFSYYPPYSLDRQLDLIARIQATGRCAHHVLGKSSDGRDLHCLVFGSASQKGTVGSARKTRVWIQHRQHPGEVAASWFCEGVVERLLELSTPVSGGGGGTATGATGGSSLLDAATVYVVPNLNPDGGVRGHHCTNASGQNLNECWGGLNGAGLWDRKAPETEAAIAALQSIGGPDILLDVHQDEEKP
jgi:murein tripeptide amidase MpaA